jgi:hypothetical protein
MKIGNLELKDEWERSYGGWFKYSPFYEERVDAAVSVYHNKKETISSIHPNEDFKSDDFFHPDRSYAWTIQFLNGLYFLQSIHDKYYGETVKGTQEEIKSHVAQFLIRMGGLVAFA